MRKRGVFSSTLIILLLILMPNAYSIYEELVYSGAVNDRDTINISDSLFEFRIDPVSSKVYVEIDVSAVIIESGECKIKGSFDICIGNVSFSYRNYTTWSDVYKADVDVYQIKSTIGAAQTIGQNNLLIDEETTAELAIENTADVVAEDVTATIKIPNSILVTGAEGCKITLASIIFNADVHPKQIKKCTYKIQGIAGDDLKLIANITFFNGIEKKSAASNALSIKVYNHSLKMNSQLNKSMFDINERLNLTINLENINDKYDLYVTTLVIKIPEKFLLTKTPKDATSNSRIISWSGALAPKEKKSFIVEFQGLTTGNYSVLTEASYKISKFSRTAKNIANIRVYCDCPYISHDFSQQIAVPGQRAVLRAFIINPSLSHDFRNVKINYHTNIPNIQDFSTAYSKISPYETIKIFDSSVIAPPLNETYYFNITAIYKSSSNQVFVVKDSIIIKVPGGKEKVDVEQQQEAKGRNKTEEEAKVEDKKKAEEAFNEPVEKNTSKEEIPVTTPTREESPIKVFTFMAYVAALIFILIILSIFKRRKAKGEQKQEDMELGAAGEKIQIMKESLFNIFSKLKEKLKRKTPPDKKEEFEYKQLEKEIQALGKTTEKKK